MTTTQYPPRPGLVEQVAVARAVQKRLYAELVELQRRYAEAHRAYCGAYTHARVQGIREGLLTSVDCPPLDPRHDPFLRDGFVAHGKPA